MNEGEYQVKERERLERELADAQSQIAGLQDRLESQDAVIKLHNNLWIQLGECLKQHGREVLYGEKVADVACQFIHNLSQQATGL